MTAVYTKPIVVAIIVDIGVRMLAQCCAGKEVFMQLPHFHVGDRVHTIQPLATLPARSNGTIYRVTRVGNLYGVLFDGEAVLRVLHQGALEHASLHARTVGTPGV